MGSLVRKIAEVGFKQGKKIQEINPNNPLTQDTAGWIIDIAKELIKPF
jgi:hypothetical protein